MSGYAKFGSDRINKTVLHHNYQDAIIDDESELKISIKKPIGFSRNKSNTK